jgi:hypothetical protein
MISRRETEFKEFMAALAEMHEGELARLLEIVETLVKELQIISLHNSESVAAVTTAHRYLKLWNEEVQHVLKMKRQNDAAKLE